jgi:RNA polymerase sigma-70 factor (ECF subfamily)
MKPARPAAGPPPGPSEEARVAADLVRRIGAGDGTAEAELVERYSRGVRFLLRRLAGDPALAEDLHQETFLVILGRLRGAGLEQPGRLAGFVRATARNLWTGHVRKTARRGAHDDSQRLERAPADDRGGQLHHVLGRERARAVRRALGELRTDRDRQILYRFYLLEESKEKICHELDLSDLHFNRVLHRARQRLGAILREAGRDEPRRSPGAST